MSARQVISFPHMGDYHVPIERLVREVFPDHAVVPAPAITARTLEIGSRHSPDGICAPFKYNLGNYIEALESGATVLLQTGLGCRYGYYGELQELILRDLGYEFEFLCFSRARARPLAAYRACRRLGSPLSPGRFASALLRAVVRIHAMDRFAYAMRENAAFESPPGAHRALYEDLLRAMSERTSLARLAGIGRRFAAARRAIALHRPQDRLRVGVVGELFTLMEPFSNFNLEDGLMRGGIAVSRRMSVFFLLTKSNKASLKRTAGRLKYLVGANGVDSVAQSRMYARAGYDGIIHMKSFGCAPELNAMPALTRIAEEYRVPILHLSFDAHTSEVGVQTRIEAFIDMLEMRRAGAAR